MNKFSFKPNCSFVKKVICKALYFPYNYLGLRYVWETKIHPPTDLSTGKRPPVTFFLWLLWIYIAFFGVASQRYENRIDIIENRANAIFTQLATPQYKSALSRISKVQNMPCPQKPELLHPGTVFKSLFGKNTKYQEIVSLLRETLVSWKSELYSVNLHSANLENANLSEANLQGAFLEEANLKYANLDNANLKTWFLSGAQLEGASLRNAKIQVGVKYGGMQKQFSEVKTLYEADYGEDFHGVIKQLKETNPKLFSDPTSLSIKSVEMVDEKTLDKDLTVKVPGAR